MFSADELTFHQKSTIEVVQLAHVDVERLTGDLTRGLQLVDATVQDFLDLRPIRIGSARDEGKVGQIACQSDPAADDNIRLRTRSFEPFAARVGQIVKVHVTRLD